jgi:hypothetical protein
LLEPPGFMLANYISCSAQPLARTFGARRQSGYALHFFKGLLFAFGYWLVFAAVDQAGWLFGAVLGVVHAGRHTALVTLLGHVAYGAIVGGFAAGL